MGTERGRRGQAEVHLSAEMPHEGICLPKRLVPRLLTAGPSTPRSVGSAAASEVPWVGQRDAAGGRELPFAGLGLVNPTEKSPKGDRSLHADREPGTDA